MRRRPDPTPQQRNTDHERLLRPPKKSTLQKWRYFCWDPNERTCLTRTPINWLSITIYYAFFLTGVFLIFFISMVISGIVSGQHNNRPQFILEDSLIGSTPSLNFFPMYHSRPLLWLSQKHSYLHYTNEITRMFNNYAKKNGSFSTKGFGECGTTPFGYDKQSPCIFFKMNRLLMWKPTPYQKGDKLPAGIPDSVKKLIESSSSPRIWLSCVGSAAKDRDHISPDSFQFQGESGFDASSYPYEGQKNFVDSIVALKFNDSNHKNVVYSFRCSAWARHLDEKISSVDVTYYFE